MRDEKIVIAKAIGIVLMVAGHADLPTPIARFIYMFHMPLFFFVSGYCFKESHLNSLVKFVNRRLKGLYWPYVKWSIVFLLLHNLFYKLNLYNETFGFNGEVSHVYSIKEMGLKFIDIVTRMCGAEQLLGGYWFLPQLLFASLIGFLIIKYCKNILTGGVIIVFATIVVSHCDLHTPYFPISKLTMLSTLFFYSGYVYKKIYDNWTAWHFTVLFAIIVAVGSVYSNAMMLRFTTLDVIPYSFCAICGIIMTLNISTPIAKMDSHFKNLLTYIGNNTMTILTFHFLSFKIVSLIVILLNDWSIEKLAMFPTINGFQYLWPVYVIIGVSLPLIIKYYIFDKVIMRNK